MARPLRCYTSLVCGAVADRCAPSCAPLFSEIERQRIIAENRLLLSNLGLDPSGAAHLNFPKPPPKAKPAHPSGGGRKRKSEAADVAPRRRSGRIAGLEAEGEELAVRVEEERKAMEAIRVISRKEREQRMELGKMVEDGSEEEVRDLVSPECRVGYEAGDDMSFSMAEAAKPANVGSENEGEDEGEDMHADEDENASEDGDEDAEEFDGIE